MKNVNYSIKASVVIILLFSTFYGCKKDLNYGYAFYQGAIPNTYYRFNYNGERAVAVSGKPFLVVKYDRVNHNVYDIEFGFSEVTQKIIDAGGIYEPTLDASSIDYQKKFDLKSPVALLVNWPITAWGLGSIQNGVFDKSGYTFTFEDGNTSWTFSYLPAGSMTGGAVLLDDYYYEGVETDKENSINMLKL